jgi:hypothetical protein
MHIDEFCRTVEVASGQVVPPGRETVTQRERLGRCNGHALPVRRIQKAQCVTDDDQASRKAVHPVVPASNAGG